MTKTLRHMTKTFRHITKGLCHLTKWFCYMTKPFCHITKSFRHITKRPWRAANSKNETARCLTTGWKQDKRGLPKPWLPFLIARQAKIMNSGTIWAFDPGKGCLGEAVRRGTEFLHQGIAAHPGGICRNQNHRRSPPDVAHAAK